MQSKEQAYFLTILSDYLNGRKTASPEGLDLIALATIAKQQQCEGILYYQTRLPAFQKQFAGNTFFSVNRGAMLNKIHHLFAGNNVRYLIFKGTEIAAIMPRPELRTMGDSDLLVHPADKQKAHELLLSIGARNICQGPNEWQYCYNGMELELHSRLMNDEPANLEQHKRFMDKAWSYATSEDGIRYRLDWNYHLVFLLLHLRKHFMNSGIGFRQFMDVAAVSKYCEIDWAEVKRIVRDLQISGFVSVCYAFIRRWFLIETPIEPAEISDDFYEAETQRVFSGGVFGFHDEQNRQNYTVLQLKKDGFLAGKGKAWLRFLFPSYSDLARLPKFRFLRGKAWLLPAAWLYRAWYSVLCGKRTESLGVMRRNMSVTREQMRRREKTLKEWKLM